MVASFASTADILFVVVSVATCVSSFDNVRAENNRACDGRLGVLCTARKGPTCSPDHGRPSKLRGTSDTVTPDAENPSPSKKLDWNSPPLGVSAWIILAAHQQCAVFHTESGETTERFADSHVKPLSR